MVVYVAELISARHRKLAAQFLRFGVVGTLGYGVDTGVVYALRGALGLYGAGLISYLCAASFNWLLNRWWTFRGHGSGPAWRQWLAFMASNSLGFVLNRGTLFALAASWVMVPRHPWIGTAAGTLAGMFANFALSHRLVFRAHQSG